MAHTLAQVYAIAAAATRLRSACDARTLTNNPAPLILSAVEDAAEDLLVAIGGAGGSAVVTQGVQYSEQVVRDGEPVVTAQVTYTIVDGDITLVDSEIGG